MFEFVNNGAEEVNNFHSAVFVGACHAGERGAYNLDIRRGIVIVFAGNHSAAGDVAEHFTPTAIIVQVFLKIVVVVVGVKEITFVGVDDLVAVCVKASIDDACSAACNFGTVVINDSGITGVAIGSRGANVHFVVGQITTATADGAVAALAACRYIDDNF